jgi:hypothetical protein
METYGHQWTDIALAMKNRTAEQVRGRYNNNSRAKIAARDALKTRPIGSSSSSSAAQFSQQQQTHNPALQGGITSSAAQQGQYIHQLHLQQQHLQQQHASLQVQQQQQNQLQPAPVHFENDLSMIGDLTGLDTV